VKPTTPWIVALLVSVLANGVLAGFVIHRTSDGPDWRPRPHHDEDRHREGRERRGGPADGFDMRSFLFALPDEAREEARSRLRDSLDEMRPAFAANREARAQLEALLVADTLDPDAVAAELERMREARLMLELNLESVVLDIISDMDPEVRAAAIEAGRGRWHRRSRPDGPRDGYRDGHPPHRDGPPPGDGPGR